MNDVIVYAVVSLGAIGIAASVILYFVAKKFNVVEDPRIDQVKRALPSGNGGGCGLAGFRSFDEATVKQGNDPANLEGLNCPVGGNEVLARVAEILSLAVEEKDPLIAVIRCSGTFAHSPKKVAYDGASSCAFANNLFSGEGGCAFGCLGLGDCVKACDFDAIHMDPETGLPVVNEKCVACGACVEACPRDIIELRPKGKKDRRIFVSCVNKEKGAPARRNCSVSCIGCGKCVKVCPFEAITLENNLAYIDPNKCRLCRKCVPECPTEAIHELNFPIPKIKPADKVGSKGTQKVAVKKEVVRAEVGNQDTKKVEVEKAKPQNGEESTSATKE